VDGIQVYCPEIIERRRSRYGRQGEIRDMRRPMFRGYFFANFARMEEIIPGFVPEAYLRTLPLSRHRPQVVNGAPLSDAHIEAVRATQFLIEAVSDHTKIEPGALVEFWRGVLSGVRAEVLKVQGRKAIISLLGSDKLLHVHLTELENIPRAVGT